MQNWSKLHEEQLNNYFLPNIVWIRRCRDSEMHMKFLSETRKGEIWYVSAAHRWQNNIKGDLKFVACGVCTE